MKNIKNQNNKFEINSFYDETRLKSKKQFESDIFGFIDNNISFFQLYVNNRFTI